MQTTESAFIETSNSIGPSSKAKLRLGMGVTGLVVLFLAFDATGKILQLAPVVKGSAQLGIAADLLLPIGLVLLGCTVLYAMPKTTVLGTVLLTGYLGGATAIHVCARSGWFPICFSLGFGVLVWTGLLLREPRVLRLILARR